jgi:hypothetical protein
MRSTKVFLCFIILLSGLQVFSQRTGAIILTEDSRISMLTCSPGEDLYSVFGHSAIRVTDPNHRLDMVFNYGTFDFSTPNFYLKFVKGRLDYILSTSDFFSFLYEYQADQRWVIEQVLDIPLDEKQFLFDSLRMNYLPENRAYRYDFFFDNCATRIRDIFYESIDSLVYKEVSITANDKSFRQLLTPYISHIPWIRLGINLALGSLADRQATEWETMFLPDHMLDHFRYARLSTQESPLLAYPEVVILEGKDTPSRKIKLHDPLIVFWILFVLGLVVTYFDMKRNQTNKWFDSVIFGFAGLLGLLLTFLWFGTEHTVMGNNYNLIWAMPLHLAAVYLMFTGKSSSLVRKYFFAISVLLGLTVVGWRVLPQELPLPLLPLILLMILRSFNISKRYRMNPSG